MLSTHRRRHRTGLTVAVLAALFLAPFSATPSAPAADAERAGAHCASRDRVARILINDMRGKHEGRMHGVPPTYNWAKKPRVGVGNQPGKHNFRAFSVWGQIYEARSGNPARNVRVSVKHIQGWIYSQSRGRWQRVVKSKGVFGRNYVEDYTGNTSVDAPLRKEKGGAVSSTLGNGYNFHFFPMKARRVIDPRDIGGVVTVYSAKVIKDDPNGVDERSRARYLASSGGDYWLDKWVGAAPGTVADVGIGKARYLTTKWKTFTMSTMGPKKLRAETPRVCLRGR